MKRKYLIIPLLMIVGLLMFGCGSDEIVEPEFYDNQDIYVRISVSQDSCLLGYAIPSSCNIDVQILKNSGECCRSIYNGQIDAGVNRFYWNLRNNNGDRVSKGIYCLVVAGGFYHRQWLEIY